MLLRARADVLFQQVGDEGVLLSLHDEVYYGLNEPATHAWRLLQAEACGIAAVAAHLAGRYPEVSRVELEADVAELLADLQAQGLLERVAAPAVSAPRPLLSRAS